MPGIIGITNTVVDATAFEHFGQLYFLSDGLPGSDHCCNQAISVRRERRWSTAGGKTRPGTGSFHPVAIGAAVEATKPSEPPV